MRANERAAWAKRIGAVTPRRANKYRARGVVADGIRFDSGKEARRYRDLTILQRIGAIAGLECHPEFRIDVVELFRVHAVAPHLPIVACGVYTADFRYVLTSSGEVVIEDVKSDPTRTTAYRLRKRLVEAIYGITIREV